MAACDSPPEPRKTNFQVARPGVKAQYDRKSGRLTRLEVDTNKNGVIDAWTHMEGTRIDLIEIDRDEDGKIDRWEHYLNGKLERVGTSSRGDGIEDEWAYQGPGGYLERVETDTNRDGRVDKWESYEPPVKPGGRPVLRIVLLDPDASGRPTRRLLYRLDGAFDHAERIVNQPR
jgi:EF hand domain-containing protein